MHSALNCILQLNSAFVIFLIIRFILYVFCVDLLQIIYGYNIRHITFLMHFAILIPEIGMIDYGFAHVSYLLLVGSDFFLDQVYDDDVIDQILQQCEI